MAAIAAKDVPAVDREVAWARHYATVANLEQDEDFQALLAAVPKLPSEDAKTTTPVPVAVDRDASRDYAVALLSEAKTVGFLIGAGLSIGPPSRIPLTASLLTDAWDRGALEGNPDLAQLRNWCMAAGITNIEDVLSAVAAAELVAPHPQTGYLLYRMLAAAGASGREPPVATEPNWDELEATSQTLGYKPGMTRLLEIVCGHMAAAPPNPGHDAVVMLSTAKPCAGIVTTNYDICLEKAYAARGYGWWYPWRSTERPQGDLLLLKVHGSINLFVCRRCGTFKEVSISAMEETGASSSTCVCNAAMGPLVVPPVRQKALAHPSLIGVWHSAQLALRQADTIVVAGYSFSDADDYIGNLFATEVLSDSAKRILVFNASDRATRKLEQLRTKYGLPVGGRHQLVTVAGPAEQTLPAVSKELLGKPPQ